jgi:hypothetical protein
MGKEPDEIRRDIEETRARMGDTVEAIGYKTDVRSRAGDAVTRRKDAVVSTVRNAKDAVVSSVAGSSQRVTSSVGDVGSSATSTIRGATPSSQDLSKTARRSVGLAQENPLGLTIGSFAVGFLAGLFIPTTRVEEEKVGPVASQVRERAMEAGHEALERGKQVAQETAGVAREAAQEATQRTASTLKESAQSQGQEFASSASETMSGSSGGMSPGGQGDLEESGPDRR